MEQTRSAPAAPNPRIPARLHPSRPPVRLHMHPFVALRVELTTAVALAKYWQNRTISDFVSALVGRFEPVRTPKSCTVYLRGCEVPGVESVLILREDDVLR